jgi:myo-inositol-1(or 4)-monophosphatase
MYKNSNSLISSALDLAVHAAKEAGDILLSYWGQIDEYETKGESGNLVTLADKESEAKIISLILASFPEHAILAEESGARKKEDNPEFLWVIDPLDGTTNFTHQYPLFAISIALLIHGIPQIGVVYNPLLNELFVAQRGCGAQFNGKAIQVSSKNRLEDSLLSTGFAYDRRHTSDNNYAEFCHFTHISHGVRRGGAAAIDLAYVAAGRLDGFWERGLQIWDIAAGVLLVEEAQGKVSSYQNTEIDLYSGKIIATNARIHEALHTELHLAKDTKNPRLI